MASNCLYIGLQDTAENLGLPKTNYWIYPGTDYEKHVQDFAEDPENNDISLTYISFPSAKDPSFAERYPGRATIEIVAPGPFEWYEEWADKPWGKRGEEYEAKKEEFAQRLLAKLYEKFPHLEGKVDYYELSHVSFHGLLLPLQRGRNLRAGPHSGPLRAGLAET